MLSDGATVANERRRRFLSMLKDGRINPFRRKFVLSRTEPQVREHLLTIDIPEIEQWRDEKHKIYIETNDTVIACRDGPLGMVCRREVTAGALRSGHCRRRRAPLPYGARGASLNWIQTIDEEVVGLDLGSGLDRGEPNCAGSVEPVFIKVDLAPRRGSGSRLP